MTRTLMTLAATLTLSATAFSEDVAELRTYELKLKNEGKLIEHATFSVLTPHLNEIKSKSSYTVSYKGKNGETSNHNVQDGYQLVLVPLTNHNKDYASLSFSYVHPPRPKQSSGDTLPVKASISEFSSVVHLPPGKELCKNLSAKAQSVQLCLKQL